MMAAHADNESVLFARRIGSRTGDGVRASEYFVLSASCVVRTFSEKARLLCSRATRQYVCLSVCLAAGACGVKRLRWLYVLSPVHTCDCSHRFRRLAENSASMVRTLKSKRQYFDLLWICCTTCYSFIHSFIHSFLLIQAARAIKQQEKVMT